GRGGHRAAGRLRPRWPVRRRPGRRGDRPAVQPVGGRAGGRVRRRAVLRAPGDRRVRGRRPPAARRGAAAPRLALAAPPAPRPAAAGAPGAPPGGPSRRCALPLAASGLTAGAVLAFARGVGEFGATIVFAGSVRGETQTLTLGIYDQLEANFDAALAIGILLV